jgi:hypothetical protein
MDINLGDKNVRMELFALPISGKAREIQAFCCGKRRFVKVESEHSERTLTNLLGGYGKIEEYHIRPQIRNGRKVFRVNYLICRQFLT